MSTNTSLQDVLRILGDIEARAQANKVDLGAAEQNADDLVFVTFLACGTRFLALMQDLKEIIYVPSAITRVPLVQPWMRGVANVRGSLMPLVDFQKFLCGSDQSATADSRVLVVDKGGVLVGLQVPAVYGLRHVSRGTRDDYPTDDLRWLADFVDGGYRIDDEVWPVFSVDALVDHPKFRVAAA